MYRDDPYGQGNRDVFTSAFKGQTNSIRFAPDQPDYSSEVAEISRAVDTFGANDKTVIIAVIWEAQWVNLLSHAKEYPNLTKVKWIASEAITNPGILPPKSPADLGDYLIQVDAVGTTAHFYTNPTAERLLDKLKAKFGQSVATDPLYMYDAVSVAMLSVLVAGKYEGEAIAKAIPSVSEHYYGLTGWKLLDENGDLVFQSYDLVKLSKTGQDFSWKIVDSWDPSTGIQTKS